MNHRSIGFALLAALLAFACSGSDPEADLADATNALAKARAEFEQAEKTVATRETEVDEAKQRLVLARTALREVESRLRERETAVTQTATDDVLFRAVQMRLLEDDRLENAAIAASVSGGSVTLSGTVANGKQRDRAIAVAKETPGVARVESRIEVQVAAPGARAD